MMFQWVGRVLEMARSRRDSLGMRASLSVKGIRKGLSLNRVDRLLGGTIGTWRSMAALWLLKRKLAHCK